MTRTLDPHLETLLSHVLRMGGLAEEILHKALQALESGDATLADQVRLDDLAIDQVDVEIDSSVISLLALQSPVAEDLRRVLACKTTAIDLERVGDLSRNIAKCAQRLAEGPGPAIPTQMLHLGELVRRQLQSALDAFTRLDAASARGVLELDDQVDDLQDELVREQIAAVAQNPAWAGGRVDLILVAENLERVGDHATNIAEDVILVAEAENVKHLEKLRASKLLP